MVVLSAALSSFAQGSDEVDKRPARSPWEAGILLENETTLVPKGNSLDFIIQHRFGVVNNDEFDLWGLYAPSNVRLTLNYGITDYLNVGFGTLKYRKIQDGHVKWAILKQTRSEYMPISLTYFGNVEYDARKDESFGIEYKRSNRLSYYNELLLSRKFSNKLSAQLSISHGHFNQIDTSAVEGAVHDVFSVGVLGRYKITDGMGVIFNYRQPFQTPDAIQPVMGLGLEFGTSAHSFQVFVSNATSISYQNNMAYNQMSVSDGNILIGFNITRLYHF